MRFPLLLTTLLLAPLAPAAAEPTPDAPIAAEADVVPGQPSFIDGPSADGRWAVHFEDDRDSAWFTAVDPQKEGERTLDSVRIWRSTGKEKKAPARHVGIRWGKKGAVAGLEVDGQLIAVFDFDRKRVFVREEQPPGDGAWGARTWNDEAEKLLN